MLPWQSFSSSSAKSARAPGSGVKRTAWATPALTSQVQLHSSVWSRLDGQGRVKLPVGQVDLGNLLNHVIMIDGLVQDSSISSALAMEILQSCTKPSILHVSVLKKIWNFESWASENFLICWALMIVLNRVLLQHGIPESNRVSSGQAKVREIPDLAKVREKSGNFVEGQGKNE